MVPPAPLLTMKLSENSKEAPPPSPPYPFNQPIPTPNTRALLREVDSNHRSRFQRPLSCQLDDLASTFVPEERLELPFTGSKPAVLPLDDSGVTGALLLSFFHLHPFVGSERIELSTFRLRGGCSTC